MDGEEEQSSPSRRRGLLALLCATGMVVAPAVGVSLEPFANQSVPTPSGTVPLSDGAPHHYCRRSVSLFLWIGVVFVLLLWAALGVFHTSTRVRRWICDWHQRQRAQQSAVASTALLFSALTAATLSLGVFGLTLWAECSREGDAQWPRSMAAALAVSWIVASIACVIVGAVSAIREMHPSQETTPALVLLRCSCCSSVVKHALVLVPFAAIALTSGLLWRQALANQHVCADRQSASRLLLGAAIIFGSMLVAPLAAAVARQRVDHTQAATATSTSHRKRRQVAAFAGLLLFGSAAIAWAVKSYVWLRAHQSHGKQDDKASTCIPTELADAVRLMAGCLLAVGGLLLVMTCCCRLERHFVPTATTPQVDVSMLSPHATRPPPARIPQSPIPTDAV